MFMERHQLVLSRFNEIKLDWQGVAFQKHLKAAPLISNITHIEYKIIFVGQFKTPNSQLRGAVKLLGCPKTC